MPVVGPSSGCRSQMEQRLPVHLPHSATPTLSAMPHGFPVVLLFQMRDPFAGFVGLARGLPSVVVTVFCGHHDVTAPSVMDLLVESKLPAGRCFWQSTVVWRRGRVVGEVTLLGVPELCAKILQIKLEASDLSLLLLYGCEDFLPLRPQGIIFLEAQVGQLHEVLAFNGPGSEVIEDPPFRGLLDLVDLLRADDSQGRGVHHQHTEPLTKGLTLLVGHCRRGPNPMGRPERVLEAVVVRAEAWPIQTNSTIKAREPLPEGICESPCCAGVSHHHVGESSQISGDLNVEFGHRHNTLLGAENHDRNRAVRINNLTSECFTSVKAQCITTLLELRGTMIPSSREVDEVPYDSWTSGDGLHRPDCGGFAPQLHRAVYHHL